MLRLLKFLRPWTATILLTLVLVFFQVLGDLYLPTLMSEIIDKGVLQGDTGFILRTGGFMLLFTGLSFLCAVVVSHLSAKTSSGLGHDLRSAVFRKVMGFSLHEYDGFGAATLITRTSNDVSQVQNVTMMILRMMVMAPLMAVGSIFMALSKDGPLSLTLGVAIPILLVVIVVVASKAIPLFKSIQVKLDTLNRILRERLMGLRVIRAFNRGSYEDKRFGTANADITKTFITVNRLMAFMMPAMMLIINLTSLAILWFGVHRIEAGSMEVGSLIAYTQYAVQILFSFLMMTMMFVMIPRGQAAAERILEVLETEPEIVDPPSPRRDVPSTGHLEFRGVHFTYHGDKGPALLDLSFTLKPGSTNAIIGSTGSGKSTILKLIPRFYDVQEGTVLVDGVDVKALNQVDLRSRMAYIPQNAVLFDGTIRDNLRFGSPNTITDDECFKALETAQARDFVEALEGGLDYHVAQGGTNLSGGQKQRLSIARALIRRPALYLFDDSFSALDFKTDGLLRKALKTEVAGSTVLLVAQRIGTVMDADQIIVLDQGTMVGSGTHGELLANCPVYQEIAASQLSQEALP